jgi:hypothetical protein
VVALASNPSTQEADAGELRIGDQSGLYNETLLQKKEKKILYVTS